MDMAYTLLQTERLAHETVARAKEATVLGVPSQAVYSACLVNLEKPSAIRIGIDSRHSYSAAVAKKIGCGGCGAGQHTVVASSKIWSLVIWPKKS